MSKMRWPDRLRDDKEQPVKITKIAPTYVPNTDLIACRAKFDASAPVFPPSAVRFEKLNRPHPSPRPRRFYPT